MIHCDPEGIREFLLLWSCIEKIPELPGKSAGISENEGLRYRLKIHRPKALYRLAIQEECILHENNLMSEEEKCKHKNLK